MFKELTIFTIFTVHTLTQGERCFNKCKYFKAHGMEAADCMNQSYGYFPTCLRSDIEILDLSYNIIRMLKEGDLKKYSNLRILYLNRNAIFRISKNAFQYQDNLEVLDLSTNAINSLPSGILKLKSLKRLYLSQNENLSNNLLTFFDEGQPITSPLDSLDISFNELSTLPELGILPFLLKYNISGNYDVNLSTTHFAGLCNLKILANDDFSAHFLNHCDCQLLEHWLEQRNIKFTPFNCQINEECLLEVPEEDLAVYNKCNEIYESILLKSRLIKILVPVAVIILIILLVIAYIYYRKRKQRMAKSKKSTPVQEGKLLL